MHKQDVTTPLHTQLTVVPKHTHGATLSKYGAINHRSHSVLYCETDFVLGETVGRLA